MATGKFHAALQVAQCGTPASYDTFSTPNTKHDWHLTPFQPPTLLAEPRLLPPEVNTFGDHPDYGGLYIILPLPHLSLYHPNTTYNSSKDKAAGATSRCAYLSVLMNVHDLSNNIGVTLASILRRLKLLSRHCG